MTARIITALTVALLAGGCSSYRAVNDPLTTWDPAHGYREPSVFRDAAVGKVALLLAFSGGGTRASAFSS